MRLLRSLPAILLGISLPLAAHAFELGNDWGSLCQYIPCSAGGGGAFGLSGYVFSKIVLAMESLFVAAAGLALFFSAARMTLQSSDEGAVSESRQAFLYAIGGATVVGFARWIVMAFAPSETGGSLVNTNIIATAAGNIVTYVRLALATGLLANIVIQAFRLIASQGQEEQTNKAKTRLIASFIGVGIVMLANVVMVAVNPELGSSSMIAEEIAGIGNFLITLFGFLAVVAIMVAGFMLVLSVDDGVKEKAKNIIKTSIIALVVVTVAYALVNEFITLA